jgi:hypothetical protein
MLLARGDCAVAALGDKLYVIGGETRAWDPNLATDVAGEQGGWITNIPMHDVEQYDVANDVWIRMAPIPAPRFRFSAGASDQAVRTCPSPLFLSILPFLHHLYMYIVCRYVGKVRYIHPSLMSY